MFQVFRYTYHQNMRPLQVQWEQTLAMNDMYGMPPSCPPRTCLTIDIILKLFILCQKLGGCVLLVKPSL